jgi:cobalt-zinc-cadmium efflux system outer membrane protein
MQATAQPPEAPRWSEALSRASGIPAPPAVEQGFSRTKQPAYRLAQEPATQLPPGITLEGPAFPESGSPSDRVVPPVASPSDRVLPPLTSPSDRVVPPAASPAVKSPAVRSPADRAVPPSSPSVLQPRQAPAAKAGPGWSLDTLESVALERNPAIDEAAARVEAARGRWIQAGLPPNLVAGYAASEIGADGSAGQQGIFLAQEFVRGGKLTLAQQVAAQEYMQARCELEAMRWRVLTDVRRAFYVYRISLRRLDVAQRLIDVSARSADLTQSLVEGGELRGVDALQTETDLARAEVTKARLAVTVESRLRELEAVLGAPLGAAVASDGELTPPPAISWDATLARIESESPLMSAAAANVERAGWSIQYEQAQVIPNLDAQVQIQHDFSSDDAIVGVQLSGPIPIWNQNQGSIRRAFAERREAQQAMERLRKALAQALAGAFREYESSRILVERYDRDVLPKTERTIDLARQALAGGEGGFLELLTAQRAYFQTTLEYLDSLEEMWVAYARIDGFLLEDSLTTDL